MTTSVLNQPALLSWDALTDELSVQFAPSPRDVDFSEPYEDVFVTFDRSELGRLVGLHASGVSQGRPEAWRRLLMAQLGLSLRRRLYHAVREGRSLRAVDVQLAAGEPQHLHWIWAATHADIRRQQQQPPLPAPPPEPMEAGPYTGIDETVVITPGVRQSSGDRTGPALYELELPDGTAAAWGLADAIEATLADGLLTLQVRRDPSRPAPQLRAYLGHPVVATVEFRELHDHLVGSAPAVGLPPESGEPPTLHVVFETEGGHDALNRMRLGVRSYVDGDLGMARNHFKRARQLADQAGHAETSQRAARLLETLDAALGTNGGQDVLNRLRRGVQSYIDGDLEVARDHIDEARRLADQAGDAETSRRARRLLDELTEQGLQSEEAPQGPARLSEQHEG